MNGSRETELGPGPPDTSLDGLRAAVIDHWERWSRKESRDDGDEDTNGKGFNILVAIIKQGLWMNNDSTIIWSILTFTAAWRNLGEGVVAAVTLAPDDSGFTLTLAALSVTHSGERAHWVAVAQQAGVAALRTVVVVLETGESCWFRRWSPQILLLNYLSIVFLIDISCLVCKMSEKYLDHCFFSPIWRLQMCSFDHILNIIS